MSTQLGVPIRIVALLGLLMALGIGAWTFAAGSKNAGSSSSSSSATKQAGSVAQHPISAARSVAAKLSAHNKATAAGKPDIVPQTTAKPAIATHARRVASPAAKSGAAPTTIASVLKHHRVAVVLLYDPQSKVNLLSLGEAQLGANHAHAGFLRVSVLKQRQIEPFAKTYGLLPVPTILFFARPGTLVQKLVGFADQETVAQAALNAARGLVATQG